MGERVIDGVDQRGDRRLGALRLAGLAVLFAAMFAGTPGPAEPGDRAFDPGAIALLAVAVGALFLAHRYPTTVALFALALTALWNLVGYTNEVINAPTLVAFYHVGAYCQRRRQLVAVAVAVALTTVAMIASGEPWADAVSAVGWTAAAVLLGEVVRQRRLLVDHLAQRANDAEEQATAEAEQRITAARLAIARELHDVLAHTVSAISVQAAVAADALDRKPEAAAPALRSIRRSARESMDEVRATITLLRDHGDPDDLHPAPGLADLAELLDTARAAGLHVEPCLAGPCTLPPLLELTAYRIVQEAITNTVRHAHATRLTVELTTVGAAVHLRITDDGTPSTTTAPGHGLRGMRERVEAVGGTLHTGPLATGGFEVAATLPLRETVP